MSVLEIAYDLRAPGRDYQSLHAAIKVYGTWCHPLESTWLVATETGNSVVRDALAKHIDRNDGLLVTTLTGEASWMGLSTEVTNWINQQLSRVARY